MQEASEALSRLRAVLGQIPSRIVACSGGVDSLVLATVAHRADPANTVVAHTVTPAVPAAGTARVLSYGQAEQWNLELVRSGEFDDERYLANPVDRCYHCKSHLYAATETLRTELAVGDAVVLSGANTDDLSEYRPGLVAAAEHGVRHPYVEAEIDKSAIRAVARHLGLDAAELAASPCLASRLYTGTRVSETRLRAVEVGETTIQELTGIGVVRCRIRGTQVRVEVADEDRAAITPEVLATTGRAMRAVESSLGEPEIDPRPYRPGRAFVINR